MNHTLYDEIVWTCQDNPDVTFLASLDSYLKHWKPQAILIDGKCNAIANSEPILDLHKLTSTGSVMLSMSDDRQDHIKMVAGLFDADNLKQFVEEDWVLAGVMVTVLPTGVEIMRIGKSYIGKRKTLFPDIPLLLSGGTISISEEHPMWTSLYKNLLDKAEVKIEAVSNAIKLLLPFTTWVQDTLAFLCDKQVNLLTFRPKAPRFNSRNKLIRKGLFGYTVVYTP